MERPRARSGTGCSLVGPGRCGDSGEAGRAGRSRSATASAHGSVPAPISFRSDRQRGSGLEFQRLQKRTVASRVVEGMLDALLLDVTGFVIDVRNAGQQASEIDRSGAELRVARAILHDVLQVEAPVAIAVPLEIGERIATTHDHVADVELVADDRRVGSLHEPVVRYGAVDGRHVVRLVVEGEPDTRAPGRGAGGVEAVGPLPARRTPRARAALRDRGRPGLARWSVRSYRMTRAARRRCTPWPARPPVCRRGRAPSRRAPNRARARSG